jgi:hypothetical protein
MNRKPLPLSYAGKMDPGGQLVVVGPQALVAAKPRKQPGSRKCPAGAKPLALPGPPQLALSSPSQLALGGPSQLALGGPAQLALGGPSQLALGGPPRLALSGPSQLALVPRGQPYEAVADLYGASPQPLVYTEFQNFRGSVILKRPTAPPPASGWQVRSNYRACRTHLLS